MSSLNAGTAAVKVAEAEAAEAEAEAEAAEAEVAAAEAEAEAAAAVEAVEVEKLSEKREIIAEIAKFLRDPTITKENKNKGLSLNELKKALKDIDQLAKTNYKIQNKNSNIIRKVRNTRRAKVGVNRLMKEQEAANMAAKIAAYYADYSKGLIRNNVTYPTGKNPNAYKALLEAELTARLDKESKQKEIINALLKKGLPRTPKSPVSINEDSALAKRLRELYKNTTGKPYYGGRRTYKHTRRHKTRRY